MYTRWSTTLPILLLLLFGVAAEARETEFCSAKDEEWSSQEHMARMQQLGITCVKVYYTLNSVENQANPYRWVGRYFDQGFMVKMVLRIDDPQGQNPLERVLAGDYDQALVNLVEAIQASGRSVIIVPWHEIDGDWYPWGMYAEGNIPELAAKGFVYVASRLKEADNVSIEVNFNRRDALTKLPIGEAERYLAVIDPWVDSYSFSSYNRCRSSDDYTVERSFAEEFAPAYNRLATLVPQKPINVAETSTTGFCGDKLEWFREALEAIDREFPRVKSITFVLGVVPVGMASNTVPIPWGFSTKQEQAQFAELLNEYRRKWGQPQVEPQPNVITTVTERTLYASILKELGFTSAPWSVYGKVTVPFAETFNPAVNSVTGNPFGKTGVLANVQVKQRYLWEGKNGLRFGPGVYGWLWDSGNNEQYWFNNLGGGFTFGVYGDVRVSGVTWGEWGLEAYAERWWYTTDTVPSRLEDGEVRGGVRFQFNFGGDPLQ
jgi:hypothetical protein